MRWAYGVTTVPERFGTTLPKTLASLRAGGFEEPRLFIDGGKGLTGYPETIHNPPLRVFGNWIIALWELYIRNPAAHRYAIFQDDILVYKNLRQYLERCKYPDKGYWNLFTYSTNNSAIQGQPIGWLEAPLGRYAESEQAGLGALGLIFSREAALYILSAPNIVMKPLSPELGHRKVDGAVVCAMNAVRFREHIHNPTLVQHIGLESTLGNPWDETTGTGRSWRGDHFDALSLLSSSSPQKIVEDL